MKTLRALVSDQVETDKRRENNHSAIAVLKFENMITEIQQGKGASFTIDLTPLHNVSDDDADAAKAPPLELTKARGLVYSCRVAG